MGTETPVVWSVVIPVKVLAQAKSRLDGLAAADRQAVALAMAADTVEAALTCKAVADVVVVSDDAAIRTEAEALGAEVIADLPNSGLNEALSAGAALYAVQKRRAEAQRHKACEKGKIEPLREYTATCQPLGPACWR